MNRYLSIAFISFLIAQLSYGIETITVEAKLVAFQLESAILDGVSDEGMISEHYHSLTFEAVAPKELKEKKLTVWVYASHDALSKEAREKEEKKWNEAIGHTFRMHVEPRLIDNPDYPFTHMCTESELEKIDANKAVDAMPTNARLFHYDRFESNDFRLGGLSEVGIASL